MKAKHALIILVIGFAAGIVGAVLKIMHWPYGNIVLISSLFLQAIGCVFLLYKLLTYSKIKDFLNR